MAFSVALDLKDVLWFANRDLKSVAVSPTHVSSFYPLLTVA